MLLKPFLILKGHYISKRLWS